MMNTRADSAVRFLGLPTLMRSTAQTTGGAFGLVEHWMMPPGFASPYHTHHREDEAFYVLEGEIAFVCDGKWMQGGPGTYVYGPREIPHGFKVVGDTAARLLLLCAPGGFESFIVELSQPLQDPLTPPDMAKLMTMAAKYGIDIHGLLPEQPEEGVRDARPASDLKSLNLRWMQAFNERDWATEAAIRGEDYRAYLSGVKDPLDAEAWAGFMIAFTTAFPDAAIRVDACIGEGDNVVCRWTLTGTHQAAFQGIAATGRAVKIAGIECNRFVNGRIAEHWSQYDLAGLLQQIGAMPS